MKKIYKLIILLFVIIYIACYWIGTQNFYLGSANYCITAFEDEELNTQWKFQQIITHVKKDETTQYEKYMVVSQEENRYIFKPRGYKLLDIYSYEEYFDTNKVDASTFAVKYKKKWGKVYAFKIYGINEDNLLLKGKDNITFYKIN